MAKYVAQRAEVNPVLVIGDEDLWKEIKKYLKKFPVHYCEDRKKVDSLRAKTETMMFGVVVLHKDLGYGTDIRFTGHP